MVGVVEGAFPTFIAEKRRHDAADEPAYSNGPAVLKLPFGSINPYRPNLGKRTESIPLHASHLSPDRRTENTRDLRVRLSFQVSEFSRRQ